MASAIMYAGGQSQGSVSGVGTAQFGQLLFSGKTLGDPTPVIEYVQLFTNNGGDGYFSPAAGKTYLIDCNLVAHKDGVGTQMPGMSTGSRAFVAYGKLLVAANTDLSSVGMALTGNWVKDGFDDSDMQTCDFFPVVVGDKIAFIFAGNTLRVSIPMSACLYISWVEITGT